MLTDFQNFLLRHGVVHTMCDEAGQKLSARQ